MAEYIEREAAIVKLKNVFGGKKCEGISVDVAAELLLSAESLPAADVAPVVRCKNCKYYDGDRCNHERHEYQEFAVWAYDDDFCSYGKRKDGE